MAKRRNARTLEDRVAEYVDSPMMTQRLQNGRELFARIEGNYGDYLTRVRVGAAPEGSCTCPSEDWPCKHVLALEKTWNSNPDSFFDLEVVLEELTSRSRAELIELIGRMAMIAPQTLTACGIDDFAGVEDEVD